MGKRALMIADADGLWTRRVIENVLLPGGYQVVVFPIWGNKGTNEAFYRRHHIEVYQDPYRLPVIRHIPRLRMWVRVWLNARRLCRLYGPFDVVHNHYLSQRDLALGDRVARRYGAVWACCFWGSDLLRPPVKDLLRMKPYLERCDHIHSDYGRLKERMEQLYGKAVAAKAETLEFGQVTYGCIDSIRKEHTRAECKAHFGIASDRFVLCVGYSAARAQQQLQVLQALQALPPQTLGRVTLVLQQTYCMDDADYVRRTRELARSLPCETVVLTEFMNDMECAWLRLAADAFVLAITTDAFCATIREYLYAGARVMYGGWLDYRQLKDMGIDLPTFQRFEDIPALVKQAMDGSWPVLTQEQRQAFHSLYSVEALLPKWLALYRKGPAAG